MLPFPLFFVPCDRPRRRGEADGSRNRLVDAARLLPRQTERRRKDEEEEATTTMMSALLRDRIDGRFLSDSTPARALDAAATEFARTWFYNRCFTIVIFTYGRRGPSRIGSDRTSAAVLGRRTRKTVVRKSVLLLEDLH
jgi:hypothetical protein